MTTTIQSASAKPTEAVEPRQVRVQSWKTTFAFAIFTVTSTILFVMYSRAGYATFRLSTASDFIQLPPVVLQTSTTGAVVAVLLLALTVASYWARNWNPQIGTLLSSFFSAIFLLGFLTWTSAGQTIPIPGLLLGTVSLSAPLIFGALGGVVSERVGVVNIAIEGQLLAGAFVSAVLGSLTHNPYVGLIGATAAGVSVSFVLAAFSIKYLVDQVIVGVVLNVLIIGITSFLFSQTLTSDPSALNTPPRFERIALPVLSHIPVLGPTLFNQTIIIYAMYLAVIAVTIGLYKTKWGLRLRAVGEHPQAADTVGIKVNRTRFWNVALAGGIVGFGGAYFTLGSVGSFGKEMTAGAGFIALAAVIFGRWDPIRATLAALLFGFASNLQNVLGVIGSPVPSEFLLMLPYLITIFAVAGLVGRVRGPAASGKPYVVS
ncbi:ABC transporter permease [Diaminobutyricibacter sp. McL0608]|uniref:ABC transporter permease n=1 Tax=Leifsonia sp. McL0608 TaxID=3143537 RepID=UPI0031F331F1